MKRLGSSTPPDAPPTETDVVLASAEAFELHRNRLQCWLPFARIARACPAGAGTGDLEPVRILVYVGATELDVTKEILLGIFAPAHGSPTNPVQATFVDEGSAPVIVMEVILSRSALDESAQVRKARTNYGGLLGGQARFATYGIRFRQASMDGQQAGKDASLQQAVASV